MSVVKRLKRTSKFTLKQVPDAFIRHSIPKQTHLIGKFYNGMNLTITKMRKILSFHNEAFARIEKMEHLLVILLLKIVFREEGINKIYTILQKFFYCAHMHYMKSCISFIHANSRKIIGIEIIHIARICFLTIKYL